MAIYLCSTSIKGVPSMKLHRDIGVTQRTAWFMLHRLSKAWDSTGDPDEFEGPVEVDEVWIRGKEKNKHRNKRVKVTGGRGKTRVMGIRDRATKRIVAAPVASANQETAGRMIEKSVSPDAEVFTDDSSIYNRVENHTSVNHSHGEYVRGSVHTNGIESFWSLFKRGYHGIYHHTSPKYLHRYVNEFTGRNNIRDRDTIDQMRNWVAALIGKRLTYRDLVKS